jgi:hypothetical protein
VWSPNTPQSGHGVCFSWEEEILCYSQFCDLLAYD